MKKLLAIIVLFILIATPVLASELTVSEKVKTFFTVGELSKAEKLIEFANTRLQEAETAALDENYELAIQHLLNHERLMKKTLRLVQEARDNGENTEEIMVLIAESGKEKERIKQLMPKEIDLPQTQPEILDILNQDTTVEILDYSSGKPMNEDGTVARPEGLSSSCSKLYLCKISCGEDVIDNCNSYESELYDLLMCIGDCTEYQLFYGCSMEAGCDAPCWGNYEDHCSKAVYNACLEDCEETFDCG